MRKKTLIYVLNFIPFIFRNKPKIMSINDTIDYIKEKGCSIIRFGEGELKNILRGEFDPYQVSSHELRDSLLECIRCHEQNVLVCIADGYKHLFEYTDEARKFWIVFFGKNGAGVLNLLDRHYLYGSMNISRFYIDFRNKRPRRIEGIVKRWIGVWSGRNVLFVEGKNTKLGVGNDLFDAAASIRRILCPNKNSFSVLSQIKQGVLSAYREGDLVIIALGPAATVLAYDLSVGRGCQCLDVGHIDVEYMWYRSGSKEKRNIVGKAVNEGDPSFKAIPCNYDEEKYQREIVLDLSSLVEG